MAQLEAAAGVAQVVNRCESAKEDKRLDHLLVGKLCTNSKSDRSLLSCLKVTQCSTRDFPGRRPQSVDSFHDLSDCKLIQIPEAVYFLLKNADLESINLTNNSIPRLPTKFAVVFPQISELYLRRNKFTNLPDELKELTNLEMLDISYNNFSRLPSVTYKFSKLQFLSAESNSITNVDADLLRDMSNLVEVNLYNNPLPEDLQDDLSCEALFTVLVGERPPDEDEEDEDEEDEEEEEGEDGEEESNRDEV